MSYIEVRSGPFTVYNDIVYANAGIGVSGVRRFGSATVDASFGADFEQTIVEVGGTIRLPSGGPAPEAASIMGTRSIAIRQSTFSPERGTGDRA